MADPYDAAIRRLTVDGHRLGGFDLWYLLAEIDANEAFLRTQVWLCHCDAGMCTKAPHTPIFNRSWSVCPYQFLRSPAWSIVVWLARTSEVGPVDGWPFSISAWLVEAVHALRVERALRDSRKRRK